tara:strand:- start:34 stop:1113 length:1080 start_codon:yes stop_codon:yes gene_type:complete
MQPRLPFLALARGRALRAPPTAPLLVDLQNEAAVAIAVDQFSLAASDNVCYSVLWRNEPGKKHRKQWGESFLGENGHIERANAWTHLLGGAAFLLYACVRFATPLDQSSVAAQLAVATTFTAAATFGVSTLYHTFGTVEIYAAWLRVLDHSSIYVTLGLASTADLALVTINFSEVPWQASYDSVLSAGVVLLFFVYRRCTMPDLKTAEKLFFGNCTGMFRKQHSDGVHSSARSSTYLALTLAPITYAATTLQNLDDVAGGLLIAANLSGVLFLASGILIDNTWYYPDKTIYEHAKPFETFGSKPLTWKQACAKRLVVRQCGCVCTSHAIWHVLALLAVLIVTIAREVAIARTDALREGG